MFRVGLSDAIAYRAEMLVWVLSTTMPIIMLLLWTAVAQNAPIADAVGRTWGSGEFVAYFLCVFVVRQLIASWAAWELSFEIRQGQLAMRLLRPVHPIAAYMVSYLAFLPLRAVVTAPIVVILLLSSGGAHLTRSPLVWGMVLLALIGAWLINFFINVGIGSLAFFTGSSVKVMEVWLACFFVFSGYLVPLALFPPWLKAIADLLPFRYQVGLPVELAIASLSLQEGARLLLIEWGWVAGSAVVGMLVWRLGVRRFQAFGG